MENPMFYNIWTYMLLIMSLDFHVTLQFIWDNFWKVTFWHVLSLMWIKLNVHLFLSSSSKNILKRIG
jgi:hypothetical protein